MVELTLDLDGLELVELTLDLGELGFDELGLGELDCGELDLGELDFGELGLPELGFDELGLGELDCGELGFGELERGLGLPLGDPELAFVLEFVIRAIFETPKSAAGFATRKAVAHFAKTSRVEYQSHLAVKRLIARDCSRSGFPIAPRHPSAWNTPNTCPFRIAFPPAFKQQRCEGPMTRN